MNMRTFKVLSAAAALLSGFGVAQPQPSVAAAIDSELVPGTGVGRIRVMSFTERRFLNVVRQQTDFTCGAASVATILRYAFGVSVTEDQVTRAILAVAAPDARSRGFSLLEIKTFLQRAGFNGDGFRLGLDAMTGVVVPTIALISIDGYEHFVVIRRVTKSFVYVADPAIGNRTFTVAEFNDVWTNKIIFRIQGPGYRIDNPLAHFDVPQSTADLARVISPFLDPLSNATLTSIGVPAVNKL